MSGLKTSVSPAVWTADDGVFVAMEWEGANCPPEKPGKGLLVLKIRADPAPAITTAWCGSVANVHGSPIVTTTDGRSNPIVFAIGVMGDSRLYAFRGDTGELLASPRDRVPGLKNFETLLPPTADFLWPGEGRLYAFAF